ncbi:hypothetical protein [Streptomyces sp. NPDC058964]|uniref:hypothetical protein n=1 Tax=Streptomyces sp. NPDC058964 TaxID=3346681 RepID=UPI0036A02AB6
MNELHVLLAQGSTGSDRPGGLYLIAWGAVASVAGPILVTNFRGMAGRFVAVPRPFPRRYRAKERDPRSELRMLRVVGGVFALSGPPTLIQGIVQVARHGTGSLVGGHPGDVPLPVAAIFVLFGCFLAGRQWHPKDGFFRRTWETGRTLPRTAVVVETVAVFGFVVTTVLQYEVLAVLCWVVGVPAVVTAVLSQKPEPAGPQARPAPTTGGSE